MKNILIGAIAITSLFSACDQQETVKFTAEEIAEALKKVNISLALEQFSLNCQHDRLAEIAKDAGNALDAYNKSVSEGTDYQLSTSHLRTVRVIQEARPLVRKALTFSKLEIVSNMAEVEKYKSKVENQIQLCAEIQVIFDEL